MKETATQNRAFEPGEHCVHCTQGICVVKAIVQCDFDKTGEKPYYVLSPVSDQSHTELYVSCEASIVRRRLRRLITKEDILRIISKSEEGEDIWVEDSRLRAEKFSSLLQKKDLSDALRIIKVLSLHKRAAKAKAKKFYSSDERLLEEAQKCVLDEFAFVLGIRKTEVIPFILRQIHKTDAPAEKSLSCTSSDL